MSTRIHTNNYTCQTHKQTDRWSYVQVERLASIVDQDEQTSAQTGKLTNYYIYFPIYVLIAG